MKAPAPVPSHTGVFYDPVRSPSRRRFFIRLDIFMTAKTERYQEVITTLEALIGNGEGKYEVDDIGKMALISWALKHHFPEFVFVGFYIVSKPDILTIGPYQGDVMACGTIPFGKGVCGVAAEKGETLVVDDVERFPGYIACDSETRSEIVVPVIKNGEVTAILDVDCGEVGAFYESDSGHLRSIVKDFLE